MTRELMRLFVRELPLLMGLWSLGVVAVTAWVVVVEGEDPVHAIKLAITFLPVLVPIAPLLWLRWEHRARHPRALPAIGVGVLWFLVTMPFAVGAAVLIAGALHV